MIAGADAVPVDVEPVVSGIGKMICLECKGRSAEDYAALWPPGAVTGGCVECKGQGWAYVAI